MLDRKSTTSEFLHNLFLQHQLELMPQIELSSNDLLIDLARIGLGIAFIPDYCLNRESKELFIVKIRKAPGAPDGRRSQPDASNRAVYGRILKAPAVSPRTRLTSVLLHLRYISGAVPIPFGNSPL